MQLCFYYDSNSVDMSHKDILHCSGLMREYNSMIFVYQYDFAMAIGESLNYYVFVIYDP